MKLALIFLSLLSLSLSANLPKHEIRISGLPDEVDSDLKQGSQLLQCYDYPSQSGSSVR
jgi:hypothetical protein